MKTYANTTESERQNMAEQANLTDDQWEAWENLLDDMEHDANPDDKSDLTAWLNAIAECASFDDFFEEGYDEDDNHLYDFCDCRDGKPKRV